MSTSLESSPRPPGRLGPAAHAALRIGAGLLFMQHGVQKLFGFFGGVGPNGATVQLMSQFGLGGGAGDLRRVADRAWTAHPAGGGVAGDRDARGLLPVPLSAGGHADREPGRDCLCSSCSSGSFSPGTARAPPAWTARRGRYARSAPGPRPTPIRSSPRPRSGVTLAHPTRSSTGGRSLGDLGLEIHGGPAADVACGTRLRR